MNGQARHAEHPPRQGGLCSNLRGLPYGLENVREITLRQRFYLTSRKSLCPLTRPQPCQRPSSATPERRHAVMCKHQKWRRGVVRQIALLNQAAARRSDEGGRFAGGVVRGGFMAARLRCWGALFNSQSERMNPGSPGVGFKRHIGWWNDNAGT